jgi:hypothetical protein
MFCPMCGAPNEEDSVFCANCGAVLDPDAPGAEAAATEVHAESVTAGNDPAAGDEPAAEDEPAVGEPEKQAMVPPPPLPPRQPPPPPRSMAYAADSVRTSGLAIASLVLGIGGVTILPLLGSILAIILGYMARNEIRQQPGELSGDGLALAGIVLGWISVGLAVLGLVFFGAITACGICGSLGASGMQ